MTGLAVARPAAKPPPPMRINSITDENFPSFMTIKLTIKEASEPCSPASVVVIQISVKRLLRHSKTPLISLLYQYSQVTRATPRQRHVGRRCAAPGRDVGDQGGEAGLQRRCR